MLKKSIEAAVRAGLSFERMDQSASVQSSSAPPSPPPALFQPASFVRRALRRLARSAKPLALPILHRMQFRVRSAIDSSEVAAAISRLERRTAGLHQITTRMDALLTRMQQMEGIELQLEVLQRKVDLKLDAVSSVSNRVNLLLQRNVVSFGDVMAIRTDAGYILAPREDRGLVLSLLESHGNLEPGTSSVLQALIPSGGVVIDVGANVGALTLPAARRVGPQGRVLALEAAPRIADLLANTVRLNGLDWVEVRQFAAGEADGTLRFNLSAQTTHNSVLVPNDFTETIDIPSRRLDTLLGPRERVDLVKIDVEGAELQVWRGMQRIVADNPDIAIILEFGPSHLRKAGQNIAAWFDELQSTGLKAWEINENTASFRPLRQDGLAEIFSINILLLRDHPSSRGLTLQ